MDGGRGVLVTRAEPEASRTAATLAARGLEPLVTPLFTATAVPVELDTAGLAGLAVTSPRTPRFLDDRLVRHFAARPAFAVGDRTAEALRRRGFTDVRSAAGDVSALASTIAADWPAGMALLHAGGEDRAGDLAAFLAPHGIAVRTATLYRMEAVAALPPEAAEALRTDRIAAVLHYSPRAAATFATRALGDPAIAGKARLALHACLSPAVAEALMPLAAARVVSAAQPDETALIEALTDAAGLPRQGPPG